MQPAKSGPTTIITGLFTGGTTTAYCTAQAGIQAIISAGRPNAHRIYGNLYVLPIATANMSGSRMVSANVAGAETLCQRLCPQRHRWPSIVWKLTISYD